MATRDDFVRQYRPLAEGVAKALGVSPDAVVAQWGLETGWGKSVVPGTHNLGNIKDFSGSGVVATDNMTGSRDKYRAYETPEAFALDYVNLIGGNKRYAGALNAGDDAEKFALGLKSGGYAEDPDYVRKMVATTDAVRKTGGMGDRIAAAVLPSAQAAGNPFDQFDGAAAKSANPFDQFDSGPTATESRSADGVLKVGMAHQEPLQTTPTEGKGGIGGAAFMGAIRDPLDAGAQLLVRGARGVAGLLPDALGGESARNFMDEQVADVDRQVRTANQEYDQSRELAGRDGFDAARMAGNVVSPANIPIARMMGGANTLAQLAIRGGAAGGAGAALQPVVNSQEDYWGTKGGQVLGGAAAGAVLTPIASRAADFIGNKVAGIAQRLRGRSITDADIDAQVMAALRQANPDGGIQDLKEIPESILTSVRSQVREAMRSGEAPDAAAIARRADFDLLDMAPTRGQVTRDHMQFAKERNLRGVDLGGGRNALADRFAGQNRALTSEFDRIGAPQADTPYGAGNALMDSLRRADAPQQTAVTEAYSAARRMAGVNADVPAASLAQRYGEVLSDFGPDVIPGGVRQRMARFGFEDGHQTAAYTVGDADDLIRVINRNYDPMNRVQARALDEIRHAVIGSLDDLENAGAKIGPDAAQAFRDSRRLASERFTRIDSSPALKAALDGADADNFVKEYVIGATTKEMQALRNTLGDDAAALQQVRAQIAEYLRDAAFKTNSTGDKSMAVANYQAALNRLGKEKLSVMFSPEEVARLNAVGRVGSYITTQPAGAAVNNSGTASAVMNLLADVSGSLGKIPGARMVRDQIRGWQNEMAVGSALSGQPAKQTAKMPAEVRNRLMPLLSSVPIAGGISAGSSLK